MTKQILWLIDATAFCYRAFYALPRLATSFGQPTGAVYGFTNMLNKILKEKKPEFLGVCFDVSRDTFRKEKFKEYKIQRPPMPEELSAQMDLIRQVVLAHGISIFEKKGYEADDIIATLSKKAKDEGLGVSIVSSDKDMLQLVDDDVVVFSPYKEGGIVYDAKRVKDDFGVEPEQTVDIIALMGDAVDNIKGVKGIGEKTAVALVKEYGSLEKLLDDLDKLEPDKLREAIKDNLERIRLNAELALLVKDVDLEFKIGDLKIGQPDYSQLYRLFKSLEFKKFLKDLPAATGENSQDESAEEIKLEEDSDAKAILKEARDLIIYPENSGSFLFGVKDKFLRMDNVEEVKDILENPEIKKIGHDLKKTKVSLAKKNIILEGLCFDTMIAAYLINPAKSGYDLNELAFDYLDQAVSVDSLGGLKAINLISQLRPRLEEALKEKSLLNLFNEIEMPLVEVLAEMEYYGINLDAPVLKEISQNLEKRLIILIDDIYATCGCQFNINSTKQLRDILFERLKLPVVKKTKTGPSTDEEVLRNLADKHKLPALLLEYRQLAKLKSTYIEALPQLIDSRDNRLHTSFNQTVTETGRLSSSQPNLQNIPVKTELGKQIRRAVIAFDHDSYLLSADYSQVELRVLAHISQDKNLIIAFRENEDIHKRTASLIYGLAEKDVTEEMRETAKRVNFGIIYGLTSFGLARDLGISAEAAQSFIDAYFLKYPRVRDYIDNITAQARKSGFVSTIFGRRRYLPEINNKNQGIRQLSERQAINTPIQGSASDLIKLAMVRIFSQIRQRNLKTKMILQIHDELVFNVPKTEIDECVELVRGQMENVLKLEVPVKVDIKMGRNWLEMEALG